MASPVMRDPDDTSPIDDDELLFRRIPVSMGWYDPAVDSVPSPLAFRPRDEDQTGLSLVRGEPFNTPKSAARGPSKKGYYIAVLRAGDLRTFGMTVEPKPVAGIPGHAEITSLAAANRENDDAKTMMAQLAHKLCLRIEGPFQASGATI